MTTAPLTPSMSRSTVPTLQSSSEVKNQSFCPGSNPNSSLSSALSQRTEQFPSPLSFSCLHHARKVSTASGSIWKWLQRFGIMGNDWSRDFKKGKKKVLLLLSQPPKRRRSVFRSQQPDGITPAPLPTCLPCWFIPCAGNCKDMGNFFSVPVGSL